MPATAYWRNLINDAAVGGTAFQGPSTVYLELTTDVPTPTVAGTPPDDTAYARAEVDMSTAFTDDGAGTRTSNTAIQWPEADADYALDIEAVEAYDAATDGNRLWYEPLPAPVTFVAGDIPQFDAGELTFNVV